MTIKISVCITTYNRADLLDNTLQSLAAQTRQPDELIVSDDCSQDRTPQIAAKWQKQFQRFHYNRNPRNLNMPGNLNAAVDLTTGEYIANLHDGDEFDPALLEKWEKMLDTYPTAGFVFNGVVAQRATDNSPEIVFLHDVDPFTPGKTFYEKYLLHKFSSIVWGTVMARRAAYDELLPFDEAYGIISDVDMWMRMCLKYDVAYVREPLIILDNSASWSPNKKRIFLWERLETTRRIQLANMKRFFRDQPKRLHRELIRHRFIVQKVYLRRLLGRLRNRDWDGLREGFIIYIKNTFHFLNH